MLGYYHHNFNFSRDDVPELDAENYIDEIPSELCDPDRNQLFVKSKTYVEEGTNKESRPFRYNKRGSPRKRNEFNDFADHAYKSDDVRMRQYKREKKRDADMPTWTVPPQ